MGRRFDNEWLSSFLVGADCGNRSLTGHQNIKTNHDSLQLNSNNEGHIFVRNYQKNEACKTASPQHQVIRDVLISYSEYTVCTRGIFEWCHIGLLCISLANLEQKMKIEHFQTPKNWRMSTTLRRKMLNNWLNSLQTQLKICTKLNGEVKYIS